VPQGSNASALCVIAVTPPCCAPLDHEGLSLDDAVTTAALFKALADPTRVRLFNLIATAQEAVCQCDLTGPVALTQGTVSHHLRKLVAAGLIEREQRGVWAYYTVNAETMRRLQAVVAFGGGT
jgi:ArsR family transcriptional regulator